MMGKNTLADLMDAELDTDLETRGALPDIIYLPDQSQPVAPQERSAPWRGRPRVANPYSVQMARWRTTPAMAEKVLADAEAAGLSYGAFMRAKFNKDGKPGPRSRRANASTDVAALVKILAELGKIGSNHNQLAHAFNATGKTPAQESWERQERDIQAMRRALLKVLGHGD